MFDFLPIIHNSTLFDFQKTGNFNNYRWGLQSAPQDSLLTFSFIVDGGGTLTNFDAKKVNIEGDTVTVLSTTDLLTLNPPDEYGNTRYEQAENPLLASALSDGYYYYFFADASGLVNHKSELFCIKEGFLVQMTGEIFNIFNTGYSNNKVLDDSGNKFHFTLKNGRCMQGSNIKLIFDPRIDLTGYTMTNRGSAIKSTKFQTLRNEIIFTKGTVFGLEFTHISSPTLFFPCIENYNYIYDINRNERCTVKNAVWTNQNPYYYMGGMDRLTDGVIEDETFAPKNQFGGACYLDDCDNTNEFRGTVDYPLDYIIYEPINKDYYKCTNAYTSFYFPAEGANWSAL